jgi:hypothetical protein
MYTLDNEWWNCECKILPKKTAKLPYFTFELPFGLVYIEEHPHEVVDAAVSRALHLVDKAIGGFNVGELKLNFAVTGRDDENL